MIQLSVTDVSRCYFLNRKRLKEIVSFVLKSVGIRDANLSIVFTTDNKIRRLNYLYRRKNRPTDVLSFSMQEESCPFVKIGGEERGVPFLGDVVISVDRAKKQAKGFDSTFKKEICLYIIHGILHLVGYSDETPSAAKRMQRKEGQILKALLRNFKKRS